MEVWPTKCISYEENIEVFAKLAYIDFEGRTDAESIRKVINQIRPKQLVLVHGNVQSTNALANYCRQNESQVKTFAPTIGELIDLTTETHIYQVTLSDPLMSQLVFQEVRDAELCWVDARLKKNKPKSSLEFPTESDDIEVVDPEEESSMEVDTDPKEIEASSRSDQLCLDVLPSNNIPSHEPILGK
jgi:cleavage and polyadenylation specificity factor subunit 2